MLNLINGPLAPLASPFSRVPLRVDRLKLAKRLWRGIAADGEEFGFELEKPLQPGDVFFTTAQSIYFIEQEPEAVLEVSLEIAPSAAAGIGWAIGNLHLELMSEPTRLLTPDDKATRQLLARIGIAFRETHAVFRPGRFARGTNTEPSQTNELGPSHQHG